MLVLWYFSSLIKKTSCGNKITKKIVCPQAGGRAGGRRTGGRADGRAVGGVIQQVNVINQQSCSPMEVLTAE